MLKIDVLGYVLIAFIVIICLYIYFDSDTFQLKCIVSTVDGNKYCVRERANIAKLRIYWHVLQKSAKCR